MLNYAVIKSHRDYHTQTSEAIMFHDITSLDELAFQSVESLSSPYDKGFEIAMGSSDQFKLRNLRQSKHKYKVNASFRDWLQIDIALLIEM